MQRWILGCVMAGVLAVPMVLGYAAGPEPNEEPEPNWKANARKQLDKAYPKAEEGMVRYVLFLEPKADESLYQVELIVGKVIETDGVNRYGFGGKIDTQSVKGWGYTKYVVAKGSLENPFSTRIGVPAGTPKVKEFVRIGGGPMLVRYNSKLPLVVYVPAGGEVRYRVWQAPPEASQMTPR
ncbi:MAG: ecotin family protein [Planctomycetota bacterium]